MDLTRPRGGRERRTARRLVLLTAAALATAVPAAPALAQQQQQTLTATAAKDSVLATGLPYGPTTVQVTRPDAFTGAPVVIGQFAGTAQGLLPFSVNTTTPNSFYPAGDCWQSGALTLAGGVGLTPDIRPGDTVAVSGGLSVLVPADAEAGGGPGGPIGDCGALSPYGRNAVTAATGGSGSDLTVSGTAQPLATSVSVSATDGHATTAPVDATLANGTWTATIPAAQLASLANGTVTVGGVYAVPDVSTGAPAHIAGAPLSIQNTTAPSTTQVPGAPAAPEPAQRVAPRTGAPSAPARRRAQVHRPRSRDGHAGDREDLSRPRPARRYPGLVRRARRRAGRPRAALAREGHGVHEVRGRREPRHAPDRARRGLRPRTCAPSRRVRPHRDSGPESHRARRDDQAHGARALTRGIP